MTRPTTLELFDGGYDPERIPGDGGGFAWRVHSMSATELRPVELFEGAYTRLRAITYSHSLPFVAYLAKSFPSVEVVLGSPKTVTARNVPGRLFLPDAGLEIEAEQELLATLRLYWGRFPSLERVRFAVAVGKPSHEKLFLLDAPPDGPCRAVFGSGNLSYAAFSGWQEESAYFCDDPEVFARLEERFLAIRARAVEPPLVALRVDPEAPDPPEIPAHALPVVLHALAERLHLVRPDDPALGRALHLVRTETAPPDVPQKPITPARDVPALAQKILARLPSPAKREKAEFLPVDFDFEDMVVRKGERVVADLSLEQDIQEDLDELASWFDHYRSADFIGHPEYALRSFEILLVFALASPFLAHLHHHAAHFESSAFRYPINAIVFGPSSGGKTSFVESLRPLSFREAEETAGMDFTTSAVLRYRVGSRHGLLIKDDVPKKRIVAHLEAIVKTDEAAKTTVFAPLVVTANRDVDTMDGAIAKRAIPIWIDAHAVGDVRATRRARLGHALQAAFVRAFRPHYYEILAGRPPSEHILVLASRVLSSLYPRLVPLEEGELRERTYESFRRVLRRVLAEKTANGTAHYRRGVYALAFDDVALARDFFAAVPDDVGAELGEKTVLLPDDGLARVGLRLSPPARRLFAVFRR